MKEGVAYTIFGGIFLFIGLVLLITGIYLIFSSFSALTGFAVSEDMNRTATNFLSIFFILIGLVIVAAWGSYFLGNKS